MTAPTLQARFESGEPFAAPPAAEPVKINASPFRWPDHRTLPRRPWVWGRWLLRSTVSAIVAPGGVGKSSFVASMLLSLASGRQELLGKTVWAGPKRVWYWNLEDGLDELEMQLVAASMFHGVGQDACADRIFLDSGPEGAELRIAVESREGYQIAVPVIEALVAELIRRKIDVLVIDPFVSSHGVSENDNGAIDAVVKAWTSVAKRANCSIVLVHHTKKLGGEKVTAEASRGAVALVAAARVTLVLNRMDKEEAQRFGIAEDAERRRLFTVQDDKANRAPAEEAAWFRLASQDVANSIGADDPFGEEGDSVGVVTRWSPPNAFDGVTADHLRSVQRAVDKGSWKESSQAKNWVGIAVANVMGLDPDREAKADRARINALLRQWIASGALVVVEKRCPEKREDKKFVEVGEWAVDGVAPPSKGWAGQGGGSGATEAPRPTPSPLGGGGGGAVAGQSSQVGQDIDTPERRPRGSMILAPGETGDDHVPGWEQDR